jgi:hypothetical protein
MDSGMPSNLGADSAAPGTKPRPHDGPERFQRLTRDEWASMCYSALLVANVGVAKLGSFARNKKGKLRTWGQCHLSVGKWLRRLDRDSENKANFLPEKCSYLAEAFVRQWQAGNIAGHGEHIHEYIAEQIHAREVEVDEARDAAVAAQYAAHSAQYVAAEAAQDIDDDDDDDRELPEGAVDWCSCPYCPLPVYPGEGSECDFCWPVGATCACQLAHD